MDTAKLFENGRSQAVRLPKEYAFAGDEVYIKRVGGMVVLIPKDDPWKPFRESLGKILCRLHARAADSGGGRKPRGYRVTYLLDTNICIYIINKRLQSVVERIQSLPIETIGISSTVTVAELEFGAAKSLRPEQSRNALVGFLTPFRIVEFGQMTAHEYGRLRAALEREGRLIGPMDLLVAAHAVGRGCGTRHKQRKRIPRRTAIDARALGLASSGSSHDLSALSRAESYSSGLLHVKPPALEEPCRY